ncbi:MAG: hypothetical protein Q9170_004174 [Blastenia crenularia]
MLFSVFFPLAFGLHSSFAESRPLKKTIDWFPCTQNGSLPLTCGTLTVPLDYTDPGCNSTLKLQLTKVSAVKQPKKGSILFNPGGPENGGRELVAGRAAEFQIAIGGEYDLIGFDPRGTSTTIPFNCIPDATDRSLFLTTSKAGDYLNATDSAIGQSWAAMTALGDLCSESNGDTGELIGTGFVARDLMQIVDALDEGPLLNYWGFSYGTILGDTVAAMFPDRMGKIVLDGNLNPHDYYAGNDLELVTDTDASFDGFFTGCVAHPDMCALATNGSTADELKVQFYDLLYSVKFKPVVVNASNNLVDYSLLKRAVQTAMYSPSIWPTLALGLHGLLTSNMTEAAFLPEILAQHPKIYPDLGYDALQGIRGGDVTPRTRDLIFLYPLIDQFFAKSQLLGDSFSQALMFTMQWPFHAKGAYTGDFHVKTKNPILFIGSDLDPITPLTSALNASAGFEGSVVLQHGGYGHTSLKQPALCTAKVVRAYFTDGTLPAPNTKCEPTFGLFSNTTFEQEFAPITNSTKRALDHDDDAALMSALGRLGAGMSHHHWGI